MWIKGGHVSDQDHYELVCHQIAQKVEELDRGSLENTLGYLRQEIAYSDVPNIVACLYEFTKSCLGVLPIYEAHPEWIAPHELRPFSPLTEEDHRRIVQKRVEADRKKQKRKKEASLV